jgi:hypothetical protein
VKLEDVSKAVNVLKKDNEIVLRDKFESPMSSPVATAVGTAFFLDQTNSFSKLNANGQVE